MKAVFLDYATIGSPELDLSSLTTLFPDIVFHDATAPTEVSGRIAAAEVVFVNKVTITRDHLASAGQLRLINLPATGVDNIDLDAAKEHGIAVSNIRAYCTQSVVEHVFGTLLTLTHNLVRYRRDVRDGAWQRADDFCLLDHPLRELSGMTLGIVGYGNLGQAVASMAHRFNMRVLVSARPGQPATSDRMAFPDLLRECDVISLHCPLTAETRGLFGAGEFAAMKRDAILINTARGALVDSAALVAALRSGDIGAASIDVLPQEPPLHGDPLLDYDGANLIVTPHIAWATREARQNAIDEIAANAAAFMRGEARNRIV